MKQEVLDVLMLLGLEPCLEDEVWVASVLIELAYLNTIIFEHH